MAQTKFKVGDRVVNEDFGKGTVMFNDGGNFVPYAVEFDKPTNNDVDHCKDGYGLWLDESDLEFLTE